MPILEKQTDSGRIYSFEPLVNPNTRILILGTIPGVVSLQEQMYYAHERNHFWDFIYRMLDPNFTADQHVQKISKKDRYQLLEDHGIGLCDIIHNCERKGSNDSKIHDPFYNDLCRHVSKNIRVIFCNGKEAYKHLKRSGQIKTLAVPITVLGSTSTMNPTNTFHTLNEWDSALRNYLS